MSNKLSKDQELKVRQLIPKGMTLQKLCREVKKTRQDVMNYLRSSFLMEAFEAQLRCTEVVNMGLVAGLSADKIAQQHNLPVVTVHERIAAINAGELGDISFELDNSRKHKNWSLSEEVLLTYFNDELDMPISRICYHLGRNEQSVYHRLHYRREKNVVTFDRSNPEHVAILEAFLNKKVEDTEAIAYEGPLVQRNDDTEDMLQEDNQRLHPATEELLVTGQIVPVAQDMFTGEQIPVYGATALTMESVLAAIKAAGLTPVIAV